MEEIFNRIVGNKVYSFMDCFLGYYQIAMVVDDKWKTAFITEWNPYHFERMSFGAMNAQMTF